MTRTHLRRWLAPVVTSGAVAALAIAPAALAGGTVHPRLPARTADQLLVSLQQAKVDGLSGTVRETANLGLPSLPTASTAGRGSSGSGASTAALSQVTDLLAGTHTLQVASAGPGRQRVAILDRLAERDIIHNGRDVWTYDSATRAVGHTILPAGQQDQPDATPVPLSPEQSARQALAALDPTTKVTVDRTTRVAGRDAYTLVLTPRDTGTLISRVELSMDAATSVPLRTLVFARGHRAPAIEVGYTSVSFHAPSASTFAFQPPAGVTVTQHTVTAHQDSRRTTTATDRSEPTTIGHGWTAVTRITGSPLGADEVHQLARVSTRVPGGNVVTTRLLSVLITDGGTVYVGAVPPGTLQRAAGM